MRRLFDGGVYLKVRLDKALFQLWYYYFPYQFITELASFDFDCIRAAALIAKMWRLFE